MCPSHFEFLGMLQWCSVIYIGAGIDGMAWGVSPWTANRLDHKQGAEQTIRHFKHGLKVKWIGKSQLTLFMAVTETWKQCSFFFFLLLLLSFFFSVVCSGTDWIFLTSWLIFRSRQCYTLRWAELLPWPGGSLYCAEGNVPDHLAASWSVSSTHSVRG